MRYVLDTTVVVQYALGVQAAIDIVWRLFEETGRIYTCDVVTCEALSGGTDDERAAIASLLGALEYLALAPGDARIAADLRRVAGRSSGRTLGDALIAALALANGATVVTRNRPDFARMGVRVLEY
jgi:predicted nucleic acid-binding protein